uniref:DUF3741 domain-containing protein n=1 Tax=Kalanchoe fedtschenkoi TaxID=63787 RepID=A0A7N0T666_KALFE
MGRDYWYWRGKRVRGGGGGGGGGGDATSPSGCMSSVFRLFDFHHLQLCYSLNHLSQHHHPHGNPQNLDSTSLHQESLKGREAPRNSVESEDVFHGEAAAAAASISKPMSVDKLNNLSIPQMSKIQIKTKRRPTISLSTSEEVSEGSLCSPGVKTPSLVVRLMGLDMLPETNSPAEPHSACAARLLSHSRRKYVDRSSDHLISGTQSLPESPRLSLARKSDVDIHHRLSLEVNKEGDDMDMMCKRREMIKSLVQNSEAEGWSPGHYAKQIVKQAKERAGRRAGLAEITNTVRNRSEEDQKRDEHRLSAAAVKTRRPSSRNYIPAAGFRPVELDGENQAPTSSLNTKQHSTRMSPSTSPMPIEQKRMKSFPKKPNQLVNEKSVERSKCGKGLEDKFKFSAEKRKPLIAKKSPQFNATTAHNKNHPAARTNTDRFKQVSDKQNAQQQRQRINSQLGTRIAAAAKTQTVGGPEIIEYVAEILKCMGIRDHTRVISSRISNSHSTTHPLHPSIFDLLERVTSSSPGLKCNRRLVFQLADEILGDIIVKRPSVVMYMNGAELLKQLTSKMASFPLSNCQVLQDIDALVGSDYHAEALEDERGSVVGEIEREILDCLLDETASFTTSPRT